MLDRPTTDPVAGPGTPVAGTSRYRRLSQRTPRVGEGDTDQPGFVALAVGTAQTSPPSERDWVASAAATAAHPPRSTDAALILDRVTRCHAGHGVWDPVDLRLDSKTLCVVTGANGSGKTTLLRVAAGLLRPTTGTRLCTGTALYLRAGSGLRSAQSVDEAVASTAALAGRKDAAHGAVARLGLDALGSRRVGTLSAGERVRVALATALAVKPSLLCLDEPTGALDGDGLRLLLSVLEDLREQGCAVLVATHQPDSLLPIADSHLQLRDGRLVPA